MEGYFLRPDAVVLSENAMVPDSNIISPAPNQFTHELTRPQPFYFEERSRGRRPTESFGQTLRWCFWYTTAVNTVV
jgi:hypothetical protein